MLRPLKAPPIMSLVLMLSLLLNACSPKIEEFKVAGDANTEQSAEPLTSTEVKLTVNNTVPATKKAQSKSELIRSEIDKLTYILEPYLDPESSYYVGEASSAWLSEFLHSTEGIMEPIDAKQWEDLVRTLFFFYQKDEPSIKMYIIDFVFDRKIERQYAVSGLMKLLSLRYPLSLGGTYESLAKSNQLSDIDELKDSHQTLVRQAYCLSLTDITVETDKTFRANSFMTRGEAASMIYRVLNKLGLPSLEYELKEAEITEPETLMVAMPDLKAALSLEEIQNEYYNYVKTLILSSDASSQKKLIMLRKAENVLGLGVDYEDSDFLISPITVEQWQMIFTEALELEKEKITPYINHQESNVHYDDAAVAIFKLSHHFGGFEARDASDEELKTARAVVPQFDTAQDVSKFAQMYSSGLLEGLYQMPGFTPLKPLSKAEALLLVKRMLENTKLKK